MDKHEKPKNELMLTNKTNKIVPVGIIGDF